MTRQEIIYDMLIVGGGPAGLSAAIYASRARMSVLVIEAMLSGGQIATTERLENYPGFPEGIGGAEFGQLLEAQARRFGTEMVLATVTGVSSEGEIKTVQTSNGTYRGRTLLIASGTRPRALGVPGEEEFKGRGVSYCATCDGFFYQDQEVAVVGGGDSALQEAMFLTKIASKVYIIHRRDQLRAINILRERAKANPKIEFLLDSQVRTINGTDSVESVTVYNKKLDKTREVKVSGIFLYVGLIPNTDFLDGSIKVDEYGYIITNEAMETSVAGVYAAGDIRQKSLRQVVTAVADGAIAAVSANNYLYG
ncbi:MAG: thioredoxin-disulfide reductase [Bacillota bacterium]|jgi:thioredoxin reductase (NADPH)|nr:thioredoxin-disulfide reductase [Bacillota bacterium]